MASPYTLRNITSFVSTGGTPAGPTTVTGIVGVTINDSTAMFTAASDDDAAKRKYPQPFEGSIEVEGENPISLDQLRGARQQTVVCNWNNLDTGADIKTTLTNVGFKQTAAREKYGDQVLFTLGGECGAITHAIGS